MRKSFNELCNMVYTFSKTKDVCLLVSQNKLVNGEAYNQDTNGEQHTNYSTNQDAMV